MHTIQNSQECSDFVTNGNHRYVPSLLNYYIYLDTFKLGKLSEPMLDINNALKSIYVSVLYISVFVL